MLNVIWFLLLGVVLAAYAILDGFDLGVGILHPFARTDEERRISMNAIGPVWDGNEVWLITFGGALFAAFPIAYATVFSAFYTPFMLLLCALIFRAAAMEFRSKVEARAWRALWDGLFALASFVAALLFGVAAGNTLRGLPVNGEMIYEGGFFDFLNPFCLLTGLLTVAMFAMHGALYLRLKTLGDMRTRATALAWVFACVFTALYAAVTVYAIAALPHARASAAVWPLAALAIAMLVAVFAALREDLPLPAFLASSGVIASLVALFGAGLFPNLLRSTLDPAYSLTIFNAASSQKTLGIMLTIVLIALPVVLAYTAYAYYVFSGKVKVDKLIY